MIGHGIDGEVAAGEVFFYWELVIICYFEIFVSAGAEGVFGAGEGDVNFRFQISEVGFRKRFFWIFWTKLEDAEVFADEVDAAVFF